MDPRSPNKLIATKYCFLILGDDTSFFFFISVFFVVFFFLLLLLSFCYYLFLQKFYYYYFILFIYFFLKIILFFHVPGCSGMFRNVPACSGMFHVPVLSTALKESLSLLLFGISFPVDCKVCKRVCHNFSSLSP